MATGTVRWFNVGSGCGCIAADEGGADLFVHRTSLGGGLRATMTEGDRVEFEPCHGGMCREAINVVAVAQAGIAGFSRSRSAASVAASGSP